MMCRFIITEQISEATGLDGFVGYGDDCYTYSEAQSDENNKVFLRKSGAAGGAKGGKRKSAAAGKGSSKKGKSKK